MKNKTKKSRPNPFKNGGDFYLTPNKIAVVTTTFESTKRENVSTTKTKYYARSNENLAKLKAVTSSVRVGRKGKNYENL